MRKSPFVLAVFAALTAIPAFAAAAELTAAPNCTAAQLAAIHTDFPKASQARGEHGDVLLKITIGKDGRAAATEVARSSGFPALDKAAADSVNQYWRFDVTHCASAELPTDSFVTIQYQPAAQYTLYGTVNRQRFPAANDTQVQNRCDSLRDDVGDQITACLSAASLAGRNNQPSLASAADASK